MKNKQNKLLIIGCIGCILFISLTIAVAMLQLSIIAVYVFGFLSQLFGVLVGTQLRKKAGIKPVKTSKALIFVVAFFVIIGLMLYIGQLMNVDKMIIVWCIAGFSFLVSILSFAFFLKKKKN